MDRPAIIIDFGNVVAFFDYGRVCERFGAKIGLDGTAFRKRLTERGFTRIATEFECGRMTALEFERAALALFDIEIESREFQDAWNDIFWLNEPVADLIAQLKTAGYQLLLGSNTNSLHGDYFRRHFATALAPFDHMVLSYEVGSMKPDASFYRACVAAAGVAADRCIFIDDLAENVAGAERVGLKAVRYVDDRRLRADLRLLGIEVAAGER
jgi:glucose-1-phosphatase